MSADRTLVIEAAPRDPAQEPSSSAPVTVSAPSRLARFWAVLWPKLLAVGLVVGGWQLLFLSGWRPAYVLPAPATVLAALGDMVTTAAFWDAVVTTLRRALLGFAAALVIGTVLGVLVARVRPLRLAVGSLITGMQTMPSIAWFPFAILLFGITEQAIAFVVILGAAPSIANGIIAGIDHVPPQLVRAGRMMGARGFALYRLVVLPAALPSYVAGLNQGWAFAWRSLMAGELLVLIIGAASLGANLEFARQLSQADRMLATMIVILFVGMVADGVFAAMSRRLRRARGLAIDD
jgi:NitT/TauT family transport system permease protein